ncbi:polysaccharide deacetylase family protein [Bosea sp. PAMC 26642]|uniref:polysaccharide deacetylase family protein n=1 Tax=Bosea sp. (strain PAMC 26642) TaxID=1792307 RepID=UPI00077016E7|nr:polysaccharide deacetylase family protein [Bosea sp. PAMC 26642]AMJ61884.1 hypothetical protein AXW83_17670 [Bosea sp. PAMC 26642]
MTDAIWQPLFAELDRWSAAGRTVRLWLRDDDAIAPSPALTRLARLSETFDIAILLAVIPLLAQPALPRELRAMPRLLPCQHGCRHKNHAPPGGKKSEFGRDRPDTIIRADIAAARQRLDDLFGPARLPVFVPPWNRIDPAVAAALPALGFTGLSCFRDFTLGATGGPVLANTHIDVMDWQGGRIGRQAPEVITEICATLAARRQDSTDDRLGVLLHHRDHDDTVWNFLDGVLRVIRDHRAIALTDPQDLFPPAETMATGS